MSKKKGVRGGLIVAVLLLIILCAVLGVRWVQKSTKLVFQESDGAVQNPMQGFYVQVQTDDLEHMFDLPEEEMPLVLLAYDLDGYQDRALDEKKLDELRRALQAANENQLQVIFRPAYGFDDGPDFHEPEDLSVVVGHIRQMTEVLNRHAEDILCVQAGMLGPWGEWHSSTFLEDKGEEVQAAVRNEVARTWTDCLSTPLVVQLRRPEFVRQAMDSGVPAERLGFHNDALLSTNSDMGTYRYEKTREEELLWVEEYLPQGQFGGEMPQVSEYSDAENAVWELERLHATYLNSRYNKEVLEGWKNQEYQGENAFEVISRRLGSRLYLSGATLPANWLPAWPVERHCVIELGNSGFSLAQNRLDYYLVFRQGNTVGRYKIPQESVTHRPDGGVSLRARLALPEEADPAQPLLLGLWVGYGDPGKEGLAYQLANDDVEQTENAAYFARYLPGCVGWRLRAAGPVEERW